MNFEDHPARRPTRYHWAAGLNPWHWVPALGAWIAVLLLGSTAAFAGGMAKPLLGTVPFIMMAALGWSGYWLIAVPAMPRFRRATDAKLRQEYANDYDYQRGDLSTRIDADLQGSVQDITALRDKARKMLSEKFGDSDPFAKDNLAKLDKLAISDLRMLAALTEYGQYVSLVDPESIERDLEAAKLATQQSDQSLLDAGQRQVELLQSRLERYKKAQSMMNLIRAQIKNVETTMKLLVDTAMTAHDPQRVGKDIDTVLQNIRDSEILTQELATYDDLEQELDDHRIGQRI